MAKNNRIMGDDIARMPPHIQASIAAQLASQGSSLPPARRPVKMPKGEAHKIEISKATWWAFGTLVGLLWFVAFLMYTFDPYR